MSLSSNCLFHYTDSLATLQKIITNGFSPSYCKEYYMAVPMISFCDIPLTSALRYMDYGDYAIGMNKDWVNRNGLNPVCYINSDSTLDSSLHDGFDASVTLFDEVSNDLSNVSNRALNSITEVYRYHKPYEGRNDKLRQDNYRFYDEREWRYIPPIDHGEFEDYLILEDYENYKKDNPDKPHLKNLRLTMKSDDIDYIIVRNKEDILPLISFLENQEDMGSTKKIKLLTTRIITKSQIEMDF